LSDYKKVGKVPKIDQKVKELTLTLTFSSILATFATFEKHLKYQCKPIHSVFKRIWSVFK
jgi:hypothetical protein